MFLHRIRLNPRSREARRDLADPYQMHRTLVRAFVADAQSPPVRFLWRLEPAVGGSAIPTVLVQSAVAGHWQALQDLPGYLHSERDADGVQSKRFDPLAVAARWPAFRFRLAANPTVTRAGKRIGLGGQSEQIAWLARQGAKHGFAVTACLVASSDIVRTRPGKASAAAITLGRVCFEGVLTPQDPQRLAAALEHGIGPAKAFGCGLLSLAKSV
jgi:CRISPR system Cascade subunit CasE